VDNHHHSNHTMAAWLFRSEHKSKITTHGQLDPYTDRYRHHTHRIAPPWSVVKLYRFNDWTGYVEADEVITLLNREATCHPVY